MLNLIKTAKAILNCESKLITSQVGALFHTSNVVDGKYNPSNRGKPLKWKALNKFIYEPQKPDEEPRPAVSLRGHSEIVSRYRGVRSEITSRSRGRGQNKQDMREFCIGKIASQRRRGLNSHFYMS